MDVVFEGRDNLTPKIERMYASAQELENEMGQLDRAQKDLARSVAPEEFAMKWTRSLQKVQRELAQTKRDMAEMAIEMRVIGSQTARPSVVTSNRGNGIGGGGPGAGGAGSGGISGAGQIGAGLLSAIPTFGPLAVQGIGAGLGAAGAGIGALIPAAGGAAASYGALGGLYGAGAIGGGAIMRDVAGARQIQQYQQLYGGHLTQAQKQRMQAMGVNVTPGGMQAARELKDLSKAYQELYTTGSRGQKQFALVNHTLQWAITTGLPLSTKLWGAFFPVLNKNIRALESYFGGQQGQRDISRWTKAFAPLSGQILPALGQAARLIGNVAAGFAPFARWGVSSLAKWFGDKADWAASTSGIAEMNKMTMEAKPIWQGAADVVGALGKGFVDLLGGNSATAATTILERLSGAIPKFVDYIDRAAKYTPNFIDVLSKLAHVAGVAFGPSSGMMLALNLLNNLATVLEHLTGLLGSNLVSQITTVSSALLLGRAAGGGKLGGAVTGGAIGGMFLGPAGSIAGGGLGLAGAAAGLIPFMGGKGKGAGAGGAPSTGGLRSRILASAIESDSRLARTGANLAMRPGGILGRYGGWKAGGAAAAGLLVGEGASALGAPSPVAAGLGGALAGAGIGTAIEPGVGTAVGAGIGAIVGAGGALLSPSPAPASSGLDLVMDVQRAQQQLSGRGAGALGTRRDYLSHQHRVGTTGMYAGQDRWRDVPDVHAFPVQTKAIAASYTDQARTVAGMRQDYEKITRQIHAAGDDTQKQNRLLRERRGILANIAQTAPEAVRYDAYGRPIARPDRLRQAALGGLAMGPGVAGSARGLAALSGRLEGVGQAQYQLLTQSAHVAPGLRPMLGRAINQGDMGKVAVLEQQIISMAQARGGTGIDIQNAFEGWHRAFLRAGGSAQQLAKQLGILRPEVKQFADVAQKEGQKFGKSDLMTLLVGGGDHRHGGFDARAIPKQVRGTVTALTASDRPMLQKKGQDVAKTFVNSVVDNLSLTGGKARQARRAIYRALGLKPDGSLDIQKDKVKKNMSDWMDSIGGIFGGGGGDASAPKDSRDAGRAQTHAAAQGMQDNLDQVTHATQQVAQQMPKQIAQKINDSQKAGKNQTAAYIAGVGSMNAQARTTGQQLFQATLSGAGFTTTGGGGGRGGRGGGRVGMALGGRVGNAALGATFTGTPTEVAFFEEGGRVGQRIVGRAQEIRRRRQQRRQRRQAASGGVGGYTGPPADAHRLGDNSYVDSHTLAVTKYLDQKFGLSMSSGYRSPSHNADIGGAPGSLHTHGSPSNPGATDSVGSRAAMENYIAFAKQHVAGLQEAMVDNYSGTGFNAHLGFFAAGGRVPGRRTPHDSVPAMLSPKEFVVTEDGERRLEHMTGRPGVLNMLEHLQAPHFATGGRPDQHRTTVHHVPGNRGGGVKVDINFSGPVHVSNQADFEEFATKLATKVRQTLNNLPEGADQMTHAG